MFALISTVIGILIGVVATVFVGKYYFAKTVAKRLTPYLQFASPVFYHGIDPEVRKRLKVFYNGTPVQDLSQVKFLIVNDGERAISDCIEPLCLVLPEGVSVLDAAILNIHPRGRRVELQVSSKPDGAHSIRFPFALLNKGEGFLVQMLLSGEVSRKDLHFTIVAADLPPTLTVSQLLPNVAKSSLQIVSALILIVGGVAMPLSMADVVRIDRELSAKMGPGGFARYGPRFSFPWLAQYQWVFWLLGLAIVIYSTSVLWRAVRERRLVKAALAAAGVDGGKTTEAATQKEAAAGPS